jgi:hypothetical protein
LRAAKICSGHANNAKAKTIIAKEIFPLAGIILHFANEGKFIYLSSKPVRSRFLFIAICHLVLYPIIYLNIR